MASLERRGNRYRVIVRLGGRKHHVSLKATDEKDAEACRVRLEENLRLVERGRLTVPAGADLGLFLLSDGKLEKPVEIVRSVRLAELFSIYQTQFTAGAKEAITREMEDIHMKHLARIIGGDTPLAAVTAGSIRQFVDARSKEEHNGYPLLVTAAHTGARRSELFRARVEDIDFDAKHVLLREKKRSRDRETFRTVDMTPFVESVMKQYFAEVHPGGLYAFCSRPNAMLTDGQTWKAFLMGVKGSKWHVLRGYHAFRHSFASNLAAAGVDQRVIDELMGHTTVEMQKRYRHLFPDQRRAAVLTVFGS